MLSIQPRGHSKPTKAITRAQVVPIVAGAGQSFELTPDDLQICKLKFAIDGLMPKHRLDAKTIVAAAAAVWLAISGYGKELIQEFAERTSLTPGTVAYSRAEFRNVIYALCQWAYRFNAGRRAPALLALYWFYSAAGAGPHPDPTFWEKLRRGMTPHERDQAERCFWTFRSHLQNRESLVRNALNPRFSMSERRRRSIRGADPLIADLVPEQIPRKMRMARGRPR